VYKSWQIFFQQLILWLGSCMAILGTCLLAGAALIFSFACVVSLRSSSALLASLAKLILAFLQVEDQSQTQF
jgi:hypothetical protein